MSVVLAGGADHEIAAILHQRLSDEGHRVLRLHIGPGGRDDAAAGEWACQTPGAVPEVLARLRPRALVLFPWANPLESRSPAGTPAHTVLVADAAVSCGARRVLYWGSSAVYAAGVSVAGKPRTERDPLARGGVAGRLAAIDAALREWAEDRPQAAVFLFRACSVVGRSATWPLDALSPLRILPRLPERPPLQVIAAVDAASLLAHALRCDHRGVYNVAADGLIAASELARAFRRPALPMPAPVWAAWFGMRRLFGLRAPRPGTMSLLARQRVIDNGRMKTHLGYLPTLSGRQALAEWLTTGVNSPS